nr:LOW QUALITY PROTEIN: C-C motif chemokine 26 [Microcebus murinus]
MKVNKEPCAGPQIPGRCPAAPCFSGSSDIAKSCCFHYGHKMLPWTWVQNYAYNGSSCPSMLFTTKRGERICAHQRKKWVQRYISLLVTQKQ